MDYSKRKNRLDDDLLDDIYDRLLVSIIVDNKPVELNSSNEDESGESIIFRSNELGKVFDNYPKVSIAFMIDSQEWVQHFETADVREIDKSDSKYDDKIIKFNNFEYCPVNEVISITNKIMHSPMTIITNVKITNALFSDTMRRFDNQKDIDLWYESLKGNEQILEFKIKLEDIRNLLQMVSFLNFD